MCMSSGAIAAAMAAKSMGRMQGFQADPRAISPELQSRLDATAANPGSAQPTYGMAGAAGGGSPFPSRGGFIGKLGPGIASTIGLIGGGPAKGGFIGKLGEGLGRSFASASSANPGGRIVS